MREALTNDACCRAVEGWLRRLRPGLDAQVLLADDHFVVRLHLPGLAPVTWTWPVAEPAYDADLGDPWSEEQAHYLALLVVEENTVYIDQDASRAPAASGGTTGLRRRGWWRRRR